MLDRRTLLRSLGVGGAVLLAPRPLLAFDQHDDGPPPQTGFEERGGESWTTLDEEYAFLEEVAARSPRVRLEEIGRTSQDRPLHLVTLGHPTPRDVAGVRSVPSMLHLGCQHGNEPAGREAVLQYLRDLAFTDDPVLVRQLSEQAILVNPTTNPNGRANNQRTNGTMDINRDHLGLTQPEIQAIHAVIRDYAPDVILDHHEYGPSLPVVYDSEILYLWPRNLNVDPGVHSLAYTLAEYYIGDGARGAGYTADHYGLYKAAGQEITQTAGGPDEGIARNAMGLRHTLGILIESAVSVSALRPGEALSGTENRLRRAASQYQTVVDALRFMRDQGHLAHAARLHAAERAAVVGADRSRPTWWGGADNEEPTPAQIDDPPACHYDLTAAQAEQLAQTFALHGIALDGLSASLGQAARPVIPLLLDSRGSRNVTSATPVYDCD